MSKPVDLLRGENRGEKPPKANWFIALCGVVILAGAYYIAVTIEDPLSALSMFFVAVIMVIIATYLLFIAGDNVPSAAEEQALLLQDQSFCVGVIDAISNEEKRRRSCLNMCAVHYGACHALGYGMSLCR